MDWIASPAARNDEGSESGPPPRRTRGLTGRARVARHGTALHHRPAAGNDRPHRIPVDARAVSHLHARIVGRRLDDGADSRARLASRGPVRRGLGAVSSLRSGAAALALPYLCRDLPRNLGARTALLAVFRAAGFRDIARALHAGCPRARAQCRRLWRGGRAGGDPDGAARPMGSGDRRQHEPTSGASPDHPAAGNPHDDPALGQSLHRAAQIDGAGLAHHHLRSLFQGAGDEPDDDEDDRHLHPRAADLSVDLANHHHRHAAPGECRVARPCARAGAVMLWDWEYALEILPILGNAAIITVEATFLGFLIVASLGLVFAILRMLGPTIAAPVTILVELVRSTPLLIQIFFLYFVLPKFGVTLYAFTAGVLALRLHYAIY